MRDEYNIVNGVIKEEIQNLANQGELYQYMITSVCIGLVIFAEAIIIPFFSSTIKKKSLVIAIFADIEMGEIKQVMESQKLDLKKIIFKKKWISQAEGNYNYFWEKVADAHQISKEKKAQEKKNEIIQDIIKDLAIEIKKEEVQQEKEEEIDKKIKRKELLSAIE